MVMVKPAPWGAGVSAGAKPSSSLSVDARAPDADPRAATRTDVETSRKAKDEYETTERPLIDLRGQAIALDLFDHDFGDFDADDHLGRVVLPLDFIATAGATSDAEKRAEGVQ